jgi:hypothetical protein
MSWASDQQDADDDRPARWVATPADGPNGEPGELIWVDTGSGPGRTFWVPDPIPPETQPITVHPCD